MIQDNEYVCYSCGKVVSVLNETEDLVWVCAECLTSKKYIATTTDAGIRSRIVSTGLIYAPGTSLTVNKD